MTDPMKFDDQAPLDRSDANNGERIKTLTAAKAKLEAEMRAVQGVEALPPDATS